MKRNIRFNKTDPAHKTMLEIVEYVNELYNGLMRIMKQREPMGDFRENKPIIEQFKLAQFHGEPVGSLSLVYSYGHYKKQYKRYKRKFNS